MIEIEQAPIKHAKPIEPSTLIETPIEIPAPITKIEANPVAQFAHPLMTEEKPMPITSPLAPGADALAAIASVALKIEDPVYMIAALRGLTSDTPDIGAPPSGNATQAEIEAYSPLSRSVYESWFDSLLTNSTQRAKARTWFSDQKKLERALRMAEMLGLVPEEEGVFLIDDAAKTSDDLWLERNTTEMLLGPLWTTIEPKVRTLIWQESSEMKDAGFGGTKAPKPGVEIDLVKLEAEQEAADEEATIADDGPQYTGDPYDDQPIYNMNPRFDDAPSNPMLVVQTPATQTPAANTPDTSTPAAKTTKKGVDLPLVLGVASALVGTAVGIKVLFFGGSRKK